MLLLLWRVGDVHRVRTIRIADKNLPVVVDVRFVSDLELRLFQPISEGTLCIEPRTENHENSDEQERPERSKHGWQRKAAIRHAITLNSSELFSSLELRKGN